MILTNEPTFRENKIINDILFHLDGWKLNDHPKETRHVQSFLEPGESTHSNMTRKEVTSREVLTSYEKAKVHALNYLHRTQFPKHPIIYQAICYWAAGLLSEKAHFKDDKVNSSYSLIEEARQMLKPHVRRHEEFFTVSGEPFDWDLYMRDEHRPHPRNKRHPPDPPRPKHPEKHPDYWGDEPKELLTHGTYHRQPHPYRPHRCRPHNPPEQSPDWTIKPYRQVFKLKTSPLVSSDGETLRLETIVQRNGKLVVEGYVKYYVYVEGHRVPICKVPVIYGKAQYLWTIPPEITRGVYKIYVSYCDSDDYILAEGWENLSVKNPVSILFGENTAYVDKTLSDDQVVELHVLVNDGATLDPVDVGYVQFLSKNDPDGLYRNIGEPVPVTQGEATFYYSLNAGGMFPVYVSAIYLDNREFSSAETIEPLVIGYKAEMVLAVNDVIVDHEERVTLSGVVGGLNEQYPDLGYVSLYLDEEYIGRIDEVVNGGWSVVYQTPVGCVSGEHHLKAVYSGCTWYERTVSEAIFFVRGIVTIEDTPTYVTQTIIDENNNPIENNFPITTTVTNEQNNPVQNGMVTLNIQDYTDTQNLDLNGQCNFTYHIDTTYHGGDTIPYTLTYHQNNIYSEKTVESYVYVKNKINIAVDPQNNIEIDSPATLTATVIDEHGENVDNGDMLFELNQEQQP